jgi:hypothetical protein
MLRDLTDVELERLARLPDPEDKLQKVADWYVERNRLILQATLAFIGAFTAAFIAAFVRDEFGIAPGLLVVLAVISIGLPAIWGVVAYRRLRLVEGDFFQLSQYSNGPRIRSVDLTVQYNGCRKGVG